MKGEGGNITINAGSLLVNSSTKQPANAGIAAASSGIGNAGQINITSDSLSLTNGGFLDNTTQVQGNAGPIKITAKSVILANDDPERPAIQTVVRKTAQQTAQQSSNGGDITINTDSLSLTNGAAISARTSGQGKAGNIQINARDFVNISGTDPISGRSSALFTDTESAGFTGGNITIGNVIKPNLFRISDGAVLVTSTSSSGNAGNITVNANRFEAINGGQLIARTTSSGAAGTIKVNADRRVTISGRDATFAERRSKLGGANDENIFTNRDTNRIVTVSDTNSEVFSGFYVNSQKSTSPAGNIVVDSPIVFLDNKGRLIAESGSSNGGNINLQNGNLLLLRRNSLISTTAGTEQQPGNGGNIEIKYPKGFIIAGFSRNNDIAANAFTGGGGEVTINALGTVNIRALKLDELERQLGLSSNTSPEKRDPQNLPTNEFTAISQAGGPILQGSVNLYTQDVEPTRGTIQLPEDLGDSSRLIAQSCPVGVQGAASRFVVTGRGGLPPNPGSALSTETFLGSAANAPSGENATASTSIPPKEAQGVEIGPRGEIILTARPSTLTPHTSWQRLRGCYGK
ncbi:hypothetical protein NIES4073_73820 [Kalymmatonema gypsitolerans NIES-4073]|nr:hypothetical protein NIES4073_73820 [Scytonema sp. NIES-4073]